MYSIEVTCSPAVWQSYSVSERLQQLLDPDSSCRADYHGISSKGQDIATIYTLSWDGDDHKTAERVPDAAIMRAVWGDDSTYRAIAIRRFTYKKTLSKEIHSTPDDYINYIAVPAEEA
jgi:hypothetical protein